MYMHRTYVEKSNDYQKMAEFVSHLNSLHICDWSVGRLHGWKYGRWSRRSQDDSQFEKQAELFFDNFNHLCGILITENFGHDYYILSERNDEIIQTLIDFLMESKDSSNEYFVIAGSDDDIMQKILAKNAFKQQAEGYVTFAYPKEKIVLPNITLPDGFTLSDQEKFNDTVAVEKQRFFSFNHNGEYDEIIDRAYQYNRKNPLLVPALNIVLLDSSSNPVSSCMGYWDKDNNLMEVEVVATKSEYENRGFAKVVISECIRRGIDFGVTEISISAWEEKTRKLYSSFGEPVLLKKMKYKKETL